MKKRARKLSLRKETLRYLTRTGLGQVVGADETDDCTIVHTQDSNCGCAGVTHEGCDFSLDCASGGGPSCDLRVC